MVWQEGVNPFLVVELLSPGPEKEDLGEWGAVGDTPATTAAATNSSNGQSNPETPPGKWDVYERILRVPYYVVFSRYSNRMRGFKLDGGRYREQPMNAEKPQFWIPEIKLGLGVWSGEYEGINRSWLRWHDAQGNWVPTDVELALAEAELALAEAERATAEAEQERQKRSQLASKLKSLSPEQLAALGISLEELE